MKNIHIVKYNRQVKIECDKLGFEYRENSEGFARLPAFFDIEEFEFAGNGMYKNAVKIGHTPKGYWPYGNFFTLGNAGGCGGLSIFGKMFESRHECLVEGIKEMKNSHMEPVE